MNEFADFHERPSAMEALEMAHAAMDRFLNPKPLLPIGFPPPQKSDSELALSLSLYLVPPFNIKPVEISPEEQKIMHYLDASLIAIKEYLKNEQNGKSDIW